MTTDVAAAEQVVLLDADGKPSGSASKAEIHTTHTPLHLAFSVYIFDDDGQVLMTRRALTKKTWPGVWTNSCCGHPAPGEEIADAARRRVKQELGFDLDQVFALLPDFGYRAVDDSGLVENEVCPVFWARAAGTAPAPTVDPAEVSAWAWTDLPAIVAIAAASPFLLSPWAVLQLEQLEPTQGLHSLDTPVVAGDDRAGQMAALTPFAEQVLDVVHRIAAGKVLTYGDVADYLGEGGPRAVGGVLQRHGRLVPWWRVVRSDGRPPQGHERQALEHYRAEETPLSAGGDRVDLSQARWAG